MGVNDPAPSNITGEKRVTHSVEHRINWGYVAASVAALIVLWRLSDRRDNEPAV